MNQKTLGSGRIINETLNPPTYLRRQKSKREGVPGNPLALGYNNYFPANSHRELVVVQDGYSKN
jgi:hypothetical protein